MFMFMIVSLFVEFALSGTSGWQVLVGGGWQVHVGGGWQVLMG